MMLKLERVLEEHMEVASVMVPSLESSLSREILSAEEHGEEASVRALSSDSPGSRNVPSIVKLKRPAAGLIREASKIPP
jgi:hypothetical protein